MLKNINQDLFISTELRQREEEKQRRILQFSQKTLFDCHEELF